MFIYDLLTNICPKVLSSLVMGQKLFSGALARPYLGNMSISAQEGRRDFVFSLKCAQLVRAIFHLSEHGCEIIRNLGLMVDSDSL